MIRRPSLRLAALLALALYATAPAAEPQRKYLLERVDDVDVVQLYCDGFDQLPLREKQLVYHLYQAAVAGRDIFLHQKYPHSPELRDLLEEIVTHADRLDPAAMAEIRRYTKLFWINNGIHNSITSKKNVIRLSQEDFLKATLAAQRSGAKLPTRDGESADELVRRVWPLLADPAIDAACTNSAPGPGKDILAESANGFYRDVTVKDLEGFEERHPLNSTLVKRQGRLEEHVWRAGFDDVVPPGLYANEINAIVGHLEEAIPYATPQMARALALLAHYYRTGNPVDFRAYNIAWVQDTASPVDTINGFIEVYLDARGQKGAFEGIVYFNDPKKMELITKIADNAQWFEDHMSFDPRFRKEKVKGISAKAIQIVVATGDGGPVSMIGINLPNAADVREKYGSKSVSLSNVIEARDESASDEAKREFCWTDEEFQRSLKWSSLALDLEVNMHEVIGHASGRNAESLRVDPATIIGEYYSALEETRADLIALWFIGNPKLAELGLVDAKDLPDIEKAAYESYTRNALAQLRRIAEGNQIEEAHMRNRQLIVHWLMKNTRAIEVKQRDGKTYYVMADAEAWREGVGRLLAEVQRIKSEGDRKAAEALFLEHGTYFEPALRDEVAARFKRLDLASTMGLVMPRLTPRRGPTGEITDVEISYPCDLESQMLEWSGRK
ncbi:MAG: dipeptidyl-peptidase 3 family protein [Thermoguttaceae bacterium]